MTFMQGNLLLGKIANQLRDIFTIHVTQKLKKEHLTSANIDEKVLHILSKFSFHGKGMHISFSQPQDDIYNAEKGRTPYDLLCRGEIKNVSFNIFINNKLGNIESKAKNDITTYNNMLRLYLGITSQRLKPNIVIPKDLIHKRITMQSIVSYGLFVIDNNKKQANFFF